jgi:hypothetical protein
MVTSFCDGRRSHRSRTERRVVVKTLTHQRMARSCSGQDAGANTSILRSAKAESPEAHASNDLGGRFPAARCVIDEELAAGFGQGRLFASHLRTPDDFFGWGEAAGLELENEPRLISEIILVVVARGDVVNEARQKIVGFYRPNSQV